MGYATEPNRTETQWIGAQPKSNRTESTWNRTKSVATLHLLPFTILHLPSELEFSFIALAAWHIPFTNKIKESSSFDGTSYSSSDIFTPVEQLRANVDGCTAGFSFFLGCNCLIYVGRWAEVLIDR